MAEKNNCYRLLVGKPEITAGRPRIRVDNVTMGLGEIALDVIDWIYLPQNKDKLRSPVNTVMNFQVP
jgi:hypothetical protein